MPLRAWESLKGSCRLKCLTYYIRTNAHSKPLKMHTVEKKDCIVRLADNDDFGQTKGKNDLKSAGKCPVTECYYEH